MGPIRSSRGLKAPSTCCQYRYFRGIWCNRVPTQIAFSNSLCFPCYFPARPQIFPAPIYVSCDYYRHKTDLTDFNFFFLRQISKSLLPLESENLQLGKTKFPVFWENFQIPCVFPYRDFFWPFSVFPVQWVPHVSVTHMANAFLFPMYTTACDNKHYFIVAHNLTGFWRVESGGGGGGGSG